MTPETLTITELGGPLTRRNNGDINSGLAKFDSSWGYDPYSKPGNLTWMEQPVSILSLAGAGSIIGVMRTRTVDNIGYVYAINAGGTGGLREIRVNNTSTPDLESHSIMGSLARTPDPVRSMGMVFYGATEKIFYGDDSGIQRINFDGASPSTIGMVSSVTASVPRPMATFLGNIYFGNGNNIGRIDSTELITTGAVLSPALPVGVVVRDLDITPDGNYLQITASKTNPLGGFQGDPTATPGMATDSYKFLWNGIDDAVTYFEEYGGAGLTASQTFGDKNYSLGYDPQGTAIFSQRQKVATLPETISPHPTATFSIGNILGFMSPEYVDGELRGSLYNYGQFDSESPMGLFRILRHESTVKTDVKFVNAAINVSNLLRFPSYSSFTNDIAGTGKIYFTTHEASADANADNRSILWRFRTVPTGVGSIVAGTYETQTQLFSKKVKISEVRVYTEPLIGGNDFIVDVIGSGGSVMSGGSQRFIVGTSSIATGADMVHFNPAMAPTYACGVRITNSSVTGVANWTATKLEVDYEPAGR